ncbi:hypothetical protein [Vibrio sinaloensis]|uniref:Uncharacterized protein n=1 Tax=Photobacterium sp. (strain ATCC 43367) TaxID=379097 RepID=A0A0A5I3C7_PHOS4|nr:hypothetical protein [Vibrio sinaloensis]KGY10341.1 hypothetical protein NM06_05380 [Vibrio sinaloensis]
MTIAPSDFATLQRENLLAAYQSLKRVILMNNEFCKAYTKSKQAEIHKFFVLNPRMKKAYEGESRNTISPVALELRNLHGSSKVAKMDDPVQVKLIRARVIIKLRNRRFPLKQDVIWSKASREYSDAEFQKGRLGLSDAHSEYLSRVIHDINHFNFMFTNHYEHLSMTMKLLEGNVDLLEGRYD